MATIVRSKCKECLKDNGDLFCFECEIILCTNCKPIHLKHKGAKKHHIEKAYSHLMGTKKPTCPRHGKEVVFYCDSCSLVICPNCMLEKHKTHDVQDIDEAIVKRSESIKERIANFETKSIGMQQIIDDIQSSIDSFKVDNAITATKLKTRSEELKSIIDTQLDTFLREVSEVEAVEIQSKTEYIERLTEKIALCESQKLELENNLKETSGIDLLMSYSDENEETIDIGKEDPIDPIIRISFVEPQNELERIKEIFGKVNKDKERLDIMSGSDKEKSISLQNEGEVTNDS